MQSTASSSGLRSAAFDTVRHDILLGLLESVVGVGGKARWTRFTSYLKDRSQRVEVNVCHSSSFFLKQEVPQGSCLGPVLFTIYTSREALPSVHFYANKAQLY